MTTIPANTCRPIASRAIESTTLITGSRRASDRPVLSWAKAATGKVSKVNVARADRSMAPWKMRRGRPNARAGAHLRPGVKKRQRDMTADEMRRKGSWAVRFYGRKRLPALLTADGKPTRFALTAAAWGEPVPKTVAAARRIAAKGKRLLAAYKRKREQREKEGESASP
jgi:hypothetical protein